MLEKNCTNCKYIIPVVGADYGFCNCEKRLGDKATEHTVCSDYECANNPEKISLSLYNKIANDILLEVKPVKLRKQLITQILDLIDLQVENKSKEIDILEQKLAKERLNCADLRLNNKELQNQISKLKSDIGCYVADQEIWLTRNDYLEKENKKLWNSYNKGYKVGYEYGKQDALTADKAESTSVSTDNCKTDSTIIDLADYLKTDSEDLCDQCGGELLEMHLNSQFRTIDEVFCKDCGKKFSTEA